MDHKVLDTSQIVNGIALMLSFFVGYKYALKRNQIAEDAQMEKKKDDSKAQGDTQPERVYSSRGNYKMVLVVRNDLKMGKGKIAAQCGHGAVGAYQMALQKNRSLVQAWENTGCAKIALRCESEPEMMLLKRAAAARNLTTCVIRDAGRTQIEPNTKTVLAIGPAPVKEIDEITGHLKLL